MCYMILVYISISIYQDYIIEIRINCTKKSMSGLSKYIYYCIWLVYRNTKDKHPVSMQKRKY